MIEKPAKKRGGGFPIFEVLGLLMILGATVISVTQLTTFSSERQELPQGVLLADVPVSGLTQVEAQAALEQVYGAPVTVTLNDQEILLSPDQVGFRINSEAMLSKADEIRTDGTFWASFWNYLWQRPEEAYSVELIASHSEELLRNWVADISARYGTPAQPATPVLDSLAMADGQPGYILDEEAAIAAIRDVLYKPVGRTVELVVSEEQAPRPDMSTLGTLLTEYLAAERYDGAASVIVIDETTGEQLYLNIQLDNGNVQPINCDVAYAGLSTMKVPILVEYFRYLDWLPYPYEYDVIEETMTLSSNIGANYMLRDIGGGNMYLAPPIVTSSMRYLGLENTFIAAPYDEEDPPEYYSTPAREAARAGTCLDTYADPYMQTTAEDMALLLDMVYQCAEYGGGGLIAAYPDEITQTECQMILDVMSRNEEGPLIMSGVPAYVEVAHKHGYTYDTISDAGIVYSPAGDYVMVVFLWADVDWLAGTAFPITMGLSTATFNYFNPDLILEPRLGYESAISSGD